MDFDRRVRLEFRGWQLNSDGCLLIVLEPDDAFGLSDPESSTQDDRRVGANRVHQMAGLFWQAVYGRVAGYEAVNDAERLTHDPAMRQVVGHRALDGQAASTSQMNRFEAEGLVTAENARRSPI